MTRPPRRLQDGIEVVRITPKVATAMLIHGLLPPEEAATFKPANLAVESIIRMLHQANEVRNRTVSLPQVLKWSRDMTDGNWLWTGEPIQLDPDGFVRNGQHRLLAIVHSGVTLDMLVIRGVDARAQLVIDVGRPRTVANQMHMANVPSANVATSIANLLLRWRAGKALLSTYIPSVMQVHELLLNEPEIPHAVNYVYRIRKALRRSPAAALGSAYIEAGHIDVTNRDEFFENLLTGADLAVDDPILVLRNTLGRTPTHNVRSRRAGQLYQIVHAWNHWRKDETLKQLRIPPTLSSESFPKMH
jgi:hypothetical protein